MSHEVDSMAYEISRAPWHIGETRDRSRAVVGLQRGSDMVVAAGLDWTVVKRPVYVGRTDSPDDGVQRDPDHFATVRADRGTVLGIVGRHYAVLQNRDAFALVDDILDDSGAKYETAGSLRGGRIVWALARLPETILVAGRDPVLPYLLIANSHDGSRRVTVTMTAVRVVCMNTLSVALPSSAGRGLRPLPHTVSIIHKDHALARAAQRCRDALELSSRYFTAFEALANQLASVNLTDAEVTAFLKQAIPGEGQRAASRRDAVAALLDAPTNADFRGTAWGAFNALVEAYDHQVAGLRQETLADVRFERAVLDIHGVKRKALNLLTALVHEKRGA